MRHGWLALVLAWLCAPVGAASAQARTDYRIEHVSVDSPSAGLRRTRFSVAIGQDPLNELEIVRVQRALTRESDERPLILLSPFGFQTRFWEITTAAYADSFVARVAAAGYDVWLVDNRTAQIPAGSCESGAVDCSALAGWGIDAGVQDAMFARSLVKLAHPITRPAIGGVSGGSSAAIATVNAHPTDFSGLLMWEGTTFTADPVIRARNATFCANDEAALAAGHFIDPSVQGFKAIFALAINAPNDPSPIPVFPPGTTNLQALVYAFGAPDPSNPLNFTPGFTRLVSDFSTLTFSYADTPRVLELGPLIGNYAPVRFLRDSHCNMAGVANDYTNHLDAFQGDVLVYAEGYGFGQMMLDTAALMTHARVTTVLHPELGESDPYFDRQWVQLTVDPLLDWLEAVGFRCRPRSGI